MPSAHGYRFSLTNAHVPVENFCGVLQTSFMISLILEFHIASAIFIVGPERKSNSHSGINHPPCPYFKDALITVTICGARQATNPDAIRLNAIDCIVPS